MAIKRCPYCKAIIDEEDKYCNNCGTQLLFPEDEEIEEEIPGDKIVDDDEDDDENEEEEEEENEEEGEEEEEEDEEESEAGELAEEEREEAEEEEEEYEEGEIEKEEAEELMEEGEVEGEDLIAWQEEGREEIRDEEEGLEFHAEDAGVSGVETEEGMREEAGEEAGQEEMPFEKEDAAGEEEGIAAEGEAPEWELEKVQAEPLEGEVPPAQRDERREFREAIAETEKEKEKKYEVAIEEDELVFKTKDLTNLTGTVEEGVRELESFFQAFKAAENEKKKTPVSVEEPAGSPSEEERPAGTTDVLPPWATSIKESPGATVPAGQKAEATAEDISALREWTTDSGIGIPEKVTQKTLPFSDTAVRALDEEATKEEAQVSSEEGRPGLSLQLKARLIDVLIITALWLISLFFTARVIGVPFFRLIFGSPIPVLAFYLILLLLYFFLFLYFLGETLGDHYFSAEDEDLRPED